MYEAIQNVILSGRYELSDLMQKIDTLWLQGALTAEERGQLISLARAHATPEMGYASLEERVKSCETQLKALLEKLGTENEEANDSEYPAWKQPTCAQDAYYTGSKMTYTDGNRYLCIAPEGYGVSYGPDILPDMWQIVTE